MSVLNELRIAIETKDADAVEDLLPSVSDEEQSEEYALLLIELLELDWHTRHEDVANELQFKRFASAVPALFRVATRKYEYLSYDNSYALARKCVWAMADIGTSESKSRLGELSKITDEEISGYAKRRLKRWKAEAKRKLA